jgi:hypothetical protein
VLLLFFYYGPFDSVVELSLLHSFSKLSCHRVVKFANAEEVNKQTNESKLRGNLFNRRYYWTVLMVVICFMYVIRHLTRYNMNRKSDETPRGGPVNLLEYSHRIPPAVFDFVTDTCACIVTRGRAVWAFLCGSNGCTDDATYPVDRISATDCLTG